MKRFYSISKAQLIVLWVFGAVATFWSIEKASYSHYTANYTFPELMGWLIPLVLFLYTLGWRDRQTKK
ncbi:MAG: hypothetical protein Q8S35_01405 [bacterium]|nr:hypothetical protein [bacterium]